MVNMCRGTALKNVIHLIWILRECFCLRPQYFRRLIIVIARKMSFMYIQTQHTSSLRTVIRPTAADRTSKLYVKLKLSWINCSRGTHQASFIEAATGRQRHCFARSFNVVQAPQFTGWRNNVQSLAYIDYSPCRTLICSAESNYGRERAAGMLGDGGVCASADIWTPESS